jgi:hypothetical protein
MRRDAIPIVAQVINEDLAVAIHNAQSEAAIAEVKVFAPRAQPGQAWALRECAV